MYYKVTTLNLLQESDYSNEVSAEVIAKLHKESVDNQNDGKVYSYSLSQNYPNPFNPATQIKYSIKEAGLVQLKVYDILGKEIATLVNTNKEAGNYSVDFNASQLPSSVYIYQLTTPGFTQARKMIFTK